MALDDDTIRQLREVLLRQTTALVYHEGRPIGTAFFISEDLLLTCAHVAVAQTVTIQPFGRVCRPATVVQRAAEPKTDLALLRSSLGDAEPSPCVVLGTRLDTYDCLVAGYPLGSPEAPGSQVLKVAGHPSTSPAGVDLILVLGPGQIITWGMSGGPVVNTGSGTVVAIVRTSKDPTNALGGGAIPISLAAREFEQVRVALRKESLAMVPWRDVLGKEIWERQLRRFWHIGKRIDLWLSGGWNKWKVEIELASGVVTPLHEGPNFGEKVAEAIFHWAQRRYMRGTEEVALLGHLLARALCPDPLPAPLRALRRADDILVRLHIDPGNNPGNDLGDIPWELTADPFSPFSRDTRFLAADRSFQFIRVVHKEDTSAEQSPPGAPPEPTPGASVAVLGAVPRPPKKWEYADIPGSHGGEPYSWPDADTVCADLQNSVAGDGFTFDLLEPPTPGALQRALGTGRYDVFHYMGTGRREADGRAQIAFVDENGHVWWEDVHDILREVADAGVRLVVLELMLAPKNVDLPQLTYSKLGDVIPGTVEAAVLTNLPVHPDLCRTFNREFYKVLRQGESIEKATQEARYQLRHEKPVEDAAGFGWFTVVTSSELSGTWLITPLSQDRFVIGTQQPPVRGGGGPPSKEA